jgi:hypothetical protein
MAGELLKLMAGLLHLAIGIAVDFAGAGSAGRKRAEETGALADLAGPHRDCERVERSATRLARLCSMKTAISCGVILRY